MATNYGELGLLEHVCQASHWRTTATPLSCRTTASQLTSKLENNSISAHVSAGGQQQPNTLLGWRTGVPAHISSGERQRPSSHLIWRTTASQRMAWLEDGVPVCRQACTSTCNRYKSPFQRKCMLIMQTLCAFLKYKERKPGSCLIFL